MALEMAHDLADHRLGPPEVRRGLAHRERPGHRQVLKHRARRARQLAARSVAPVKRQVHGPEDLGEPFRLRLLLGHANQRPGRAIHRQSRWITAASRSKTCTACSTDSPLVSGRNRYTNPIAATHKTAKHTMTQPSPMELCQTGNASISA